MFFTLLIVTIAFTVCVCWSIVTLVTDTHNIHLPFNNPLLSSFELILHCFTDIAILTDSAALPHCSNSIHFSDPSVTSSPWHLSHSSNLHFHIYHYSLIRFACLSAKDCRTPQTVTLQSLWSHHSHTHCTAFGFWILLLCTVLIRQLSVYHCQKIFKAWGEGLTNGVWEFIAKYVQMACNGSNFSSLLLFPGSIKVIIRHCAWFASPVLYPEIKINALHVKLSCTSAILFQSWHQGPRAYHDPSCLTTHFVAFDKAPTLLNFCAVIISPKSHSYNVDGCFPQHFWLPLLLYYYLHQYVRREKLFDISIITKNLAWNVLNPENWTCGCWHTIFPAKVKFFKALWAGLTNQHDISDSFAVTPMTQVL